MNTELAEMCQTLDELADAIKSQDDELKGLKRDRKELQTTIAAKFAEIGMQSAKFNGRTYYLHMDRFVRKNVAASQEEVCAALRECGGGDFVSTAFNSAQVRAWVKELHDATDPGTPIADALPDPLKPLLVASEEATVRSKKA